MVQIKTNFGDENRVEKPPRQVTSAVKRSEKYSRETSIERYVAWASAHGKEEARRQSTKTRVRVQRIKQLPKAQGALEVASIRMTFDTNPVPGFQPSVARDNGCIVAFRLYCLGQITQIPPRLQVQPFRRERLRDDRNPKGFHESAPRRRLGGGFEQAW